MGKEREFLLRTGMINKAVYAGIQADHCVVWKKVPGGYQNHSLCNHTCVVEVKGNPTGGNYVCEASFVFAEGAKARFASRADIVGWTTRVAKAHAVARDMFFQTHFDAYCEEFAIPPSWADAIKSELTSPEKKVEDNQFGGSPSMLPECAGIIADCKSAGLVVNLTDPGRRFMADKKFVAEFAENPSNILAMSFDDMNPDELARIALMDLDAIKAEWRTVSPLHGQRQKAYEGIYAAMLMRQMKIATTPMFNVVIHPGNVKHVDHVLSTITECVPGALANPYPAQSFGNDLPCWTPSSLPALRKHVLNFAEGTLFDKPGVTRRLQYYVVLETAFRHWAKNPGRICEFMSGIRAWDCTARPGAYRYAQIGKSLEVFDTSIENLPLPGGHLGCFWSPVLGHYEHIGENIEQLAETMLTGMVEHGRRLGDVRKTNIMPRLMFDIVATELGLPSDLVPEYLKTRREYAGF